LEKKNDVSPRPFTNFKKTGGPGSGIPRTKISIQKTSPRPCGVPNTPKGGFEIINKKKKGGGLRVRWELKKKWGLKDTQKQWLG